LCSISLLPSRQTEEQRINNKEEGTQDPGRRSIMRPRQAGSWCFSLGRGDLDHPQLGTGKVPGGDFSSFPPRSGVLEADDKIKEASRFLRIRWWQGPPSSLLARVSPLLLRTQPHHLHLRAQLGTKGAPPAWARRRAPRRRNRARARRASQDLATAAEVGGPGTTTDVGEGAAAAAPVRGSSSPPEREGRGQGM
jgi:hypothetical protein